MSRKHSLDTTNIYRFKVTHKGIHSRNGYGYKKGDAFENIEFVGPYMRKIPFGSWISHFGEFVVEHQELEAVAGELQWFTFAIKRYKDGEIQ